MNILKKYHKKNKKSKLKEKTKNNSKETYIENKVLEKNKKEYKNTDSKGISKEELLHEDKSFSLEEDIEYQEIFEDNFTNTATPIELEEDINKNNNNNFYNDFTQEEKINDKLLINKEINENNLDTNIKSNKKSENHFIKVTSDLDKNIIKEQNKFLDLKNNVICCNNEEILKENIYIDFKDEKLIDKLFIAEYDLIGSKNTDKYCYQKIKYANKIFYMTYSPKLALQYSNIYYYCSNHRTTKFSTEYDSKGNKIRINICDGKIIYRKSNKNYYMINDHSEKCKQLGQIKYDNNLEINLAVNNYKEFRKELIKYLEKNTLINYKDFRIMATDLYYKLDCAFEIKYNTFTNIYYNWRRNTISFKKFTIFNNRFTKNNKEFLSDYTLKLIYNEKGNKLIMHEHAIFLSNYFLKCLQLTNHYYIDGTYVYPNEFKQLIVIQFLHHQYNIRIPGCFILINNKTEVGYKYMLNILFNILTNENTLELNLKSITTDFEFGLINAINDVFPNIKQIGCFYHFSRALCEKAKILKLNDSKNIDNTEQIIKKLLSLPYKYNDNKNYIDNIFSKYGDKYETFKNYFKTFWIKFFEMGLLDYSDIDKALRSNSYIENYNKLIKQKLSPYLFGRSKTKISWPLFIYFIKEEEEFYRQKLVYMDINLEKKLNIRNNDNHKKSKILKKNSRYKNLFEESNKNLKWLVYNSFSCRYDSFFFIYIFHIKKVLEKNKKYITANIEIIDIIADDIINSTSKGANSKIWDFIDKYKKNYDFLLLNYKDFNTIMQLFEIFIRNEFFCFKYYTFEGCSNCTPSKNKENFLNPIINYDIDSLKKYSIEQFIYYKLKNDIFVCPNCGYNKEGQINDVNVKNYFKTIYHVDTPYFIFVSFEFSEVDDSYDSKGKPRPIDISNLLLFNRLIDNKNNIEKIIVNKFRVYNNNYILTGIIHTPYSGHYAATLVNLKDNVYFLKQGNSYYYDDQQSIINIKDDFNKFILIKNPFILIYNKEN